MRRATLERKWRAVLSHWSDLERNGLQAATDPSGKHCAFCQAFLHKGCAGCPIATVTGKIYCHATPFTDVVLAWDFGVQDNIKRQSGRMLRRLRQIRKAWLERKTLIKAKPKAKPKPKARKVCLVNSATVDGLWITLYSNGRVRIHTRNLCTDTDGNRSDYRMAEYCPKLKVEREAIRKLICHINRTAHGLEGQDCRVRNCYD